MSMVPEDRERGMSIAVANSGSHRPSMSVGAGSHRPSMAGVNGSLLLACTGMSSQAVNLADEIGVTSDL